MAGETPVLVSRPTRIAADLGEKLSELLEFMKISSAAYLDPLVRTQIENDHKTYSGAIALMRQARESRQQPCDSDPTLTTVEG